MSFPFPPNPVDGQVATQTQPDGTVLKATYIQAKNEWMVERVAPKPSTLTLTTGTPYTVTPGRDGQVLTFDGTLNKWTPKTLAAVSGGTGQTYTKGTQAAADTPNPPDPTKPAELLKAGALQTTLENLHKELKTWDGSAWAEVLSEDTIKQWISAGSLFRGVIKESTLSTLPAPALANRGFYWSWTGSPGYTVSSADAEISPALDGEVLQVGDWIQSDGTKWVHVPGDLLSKQRWDSLGSFQPWSDTSWEKGSVVSYQKAFFRASALVSPGDLAPGATPGDPTEVQKWVDITPVPHLNTGDLSNVNANTINGTGGIHGAVFQWDDNIKEWVSSDVLTVGEVNTPTVRFPDLSEIRAVAEADVTTVNPADEGTTVPSVGAMNAAIAAIPAPNLEQLNDTAELATAANGQVPAWSDANSRWEPITPAAGGGSVTISDTAPTNPGGGALWLPKSDILQIYDNTDADATKHRWRSSASQEAQELEEDNIKKTTLISKPEGNLSKRLFWDVDGILETRTARSTPVLQFKFANIPGKVFDIRGVLVRGVWRGHSHTSWDYGSATHVQTYELRSADELSLGWFDSDNRDIGAGEPFQIRLEIYAIGNKTCIASDWMGIRTTDDHMTAFRGLYIFALKFEEIEGFMLHFSQNVFSYHGRATWA